MITRHQQTLHSSVSPVALFATWAVGIDAEWIEDGRKMAATALHLFSAREAAFAKLMAGKRKAA